MSSTMNPGEAKHLTKKLREMTLRYEYYGKALNGTAESVKPLRRLIGENSAEAKAKDSRLIAAGIALIAFPDPTISDLVGAGLVAAGLIKSRTRPLTSADVYDEFHTMTKNLEKLKREIVLDK